MYAGLRLDFMFSGRVLGSYEAFALSLPCAIPSSKLSLHTRIATPLLTHTVTSRVDVRMLPCYAGYRTSLESYAGGAVFPATLSPLPLSEHCDLARCISPPPTDRVLPPDASTAEGHCSCRYNEVNDAWLTSTGGAAVEDTSRNGTTPARVEVGLDREHRIAEGGEVPRDIDVLHRQILDGMLAKPEWEALGKMWGEEMRREVNLVWHRLNGWPDTTPGLYALKKHAIVGTLSNGNMRLLVDVAKHADLPWDVVFSGELLGSYKPNPQVYTPP
ncbi:hypothetical protein PsYK624_054310 [Phanerochaete sordida]|uniref:Uncharacterized protein n=1 Tax=Phanerochaete sordida TaxID=48140 RepID=A0A9P3G529_9APHY|nr:hypothetical protein PsYK624_054310 [Phanerochaete sordida]